ncbi:MAG: hypothetical protein ACYC5O_15415 [Anaerolineae bacterium]
MVALSLGALAVFVLSHLTGTTVAAVRGVAVATIAVALLLTARLGEAYSPMVLFPFGSVSIPLVDLRMDPLAVSWLRFVLLGGLALVVFMPTDSVAAGLALLAAAAGSLVAGTLGALAIAWLATEAAFLLFDTPRTGSQMSAVPLSLGGVAMVLAVYASASQEAMVMSDASLRTLSWVLLLLAVCLRLRLWPLTWPDAEPSVMALWQLVACSTTAVLLMRLAPAPVAATAPLWVTALVILSAAISSLRGWLRRDGTARQDTGVALAALLLPLAALTIPPSPLLAPALAHVAAVVVVLAIAPAFRRRDGLPRLVTVALPVLAVATLAPLPLLPFGRGYLQVLGLLAAQRPLGAVIAALVTSLAGAMLILRALEPEGRPTLSRRPRWPAVAALGGALVTLLLGLGLGSDWAGGTESAAPRFGTMLLAWAGVAAALGLVYGRVRGLLPSLVAEPFSTTLPRRSALALLRSVDTVLRLIEGETALTWTTVIGVAILAIALQG